MFIDHLPKNGSINAEAYSVGDAILETEEIYFAVTMFPVREECQDQAKCRRLRIRVTVGQRYVWDVVEDIIAHAVQRHCLGQRKGLKNMVGGLWRGFWGPWPECCLKSSRISIALAQCVEWSQDRRQKLQDSRKKQNKTKRKEIKDKKDDGPQ